MTRLNPLQSTLMPPYTGYGAMRVATYNIHKGVRGLGPRKRLEIHNLGLAVEALDADLVWAFATGNPITLSGVKYTHQTPGSEIEREVFVFTEVNGYRLPDYHRLDIAYTLGRGYNKRKTLKSTWNFSLYNVYARRNAFSVFFTQSPGQQPVANRLATLGTIFPAITLNIETL